MKPVNIEEDIKIMGRRWRRKMKIKYIEWPELYDRVLLTKEITEVVKNLEPIVKDYIKEDYVNFARTFNVHFETAWLQYYGPEAALHVKETGYGYIIPAS